MLTVNRVSKSFGDTAVLRDVSFIINAGERVGLVGPNGSGKTTLLHILTGRAAADGGAVRIAPGVRVGYLAQGLAVPPGATLASCLAAAAGDRAQAEAEVERWATSLAQAASPAVAQKYEAALLHLQTLAQGPDLGRRQAALAHLGLAGVPGATPVVALSGGQKTRLGLALVLLGVPQLLLLDEPTNHLDLDMLAWVEGWLANYHGAALVVSHDRTFLDHAVTRILELDAESHTVRAYTGNYTAYLEQRLAEREAQRSAWRDQQEEIHRLRADIARTKEQSQRVERTTTPRQPGVRRIAKKVARKALAREKKLDRYLASDQRVDKPKSGWQMKLEFSDDPASGRDVARLEAAAVGYGEPLLSGLDLTLRFGERVALIGPNGSGKTTLARTLAGEIPPLAGRARLGLSVRLGYFAQEQELLDPRLNALTTLQQFSGQAETDLRNFLHYFLFEDDEVFTPVGELSHGERARLALAVLVARGCNVLLLDEPINHLDLPSRARFEQALTAFEGTSLVITHDRYFIERFATKVWRVENSSVREYVDAGEALYGKRESATPDFADDPE